MYWTVLCTCEFFSFSFCHFPYLSEDLIDLRFTSPFYMSRSRTHPAMVCSTFLASFIENHTYFWIEFINRKWQIRRTRNNIWLGFGFCDTSLILAEYFMNTRERVTQTELEGRERETKSQSRMQISVESINLICERFPFAYDLWAHTTTPTKNRKFLILTTLAHPSIVCDAMTLKKSWTKSKYNHSNMHNCAFVYSDYLSGFLSWCK